MASSSTAGRRRGTAAAAARAALAAAGMTRLLLLLLLLQLVLLLVPLATAAGSPPTGGNKPRFALFGAARDTVGLPPHSNSQKERVLQGGNDRGSMALTEEERKWDTGRFVRAVVDAQVGRFNW